jgi:hypothetical protein
MINKYIYSYLIYKNNKTTCGSMIFQKNFDMVNQITKAFSSLTSRFIFKRLH